MAKKKKPSELLKPHVAIWNSSSGPAKRTMTPIEAGNVVFLQEDGNYFQIGGRDGYITVMGSGPDGYGMLVEPVMGNVVRISFKKRIETPKSHLRRSSIQNLVCIAGEREHDT